MFSVLFLFSFYIPFDDPVVQEADRAVRSEMAWTQGLVLDAANVEETNPLTLSLEYVDGGLRWVVETTHPHRTSYDQWVTGEEPTVRLTSE